MNTLDITEDLFGIDISHNNGSINWNKVKTSQPRIRFVYIKATQGVGYTDPQAKNSATGALQSGLRFGYYHFASLNSIDALHDAQSEADYFDSILKTLPPASLPPVLDIETNDKRLNTQQVQQWIAAFFQRMETLGHHHMIIYSYKPFFDSNLPAKHTFGNIPLWLAQYRNVPAPSLPNGWSRFLIWQFTDKGKVDGINGDCDLNKAKPELFLLMNEPA
jgi:lysozyme